MPRRKKRRRRNKGQRPPPPEGEEANREKSATSRMKTEPPTTTRSRTPRSSGRRRTAVYAHSGKGQRRALWDPLVSGKSAGNLGPKAQPSSTPRTDTRRATTPTTRASTWTKGGSEGEEGEWKKAASAARRGGGARGTDHQGGGADDLEDQEQEEVRRKRGGASEGTGPEVHERRGAPLQRGHVRHGRPKRAQLEGGRERGGEVEQRSHRKIKRGGRPHLDPRARKDHRRGRG